MAGPTTVTRDILVETRKKEPATATDLDADETQDWLESVDALVATLGLRRARKVLLRAIARAREDGIELASPLVTDYTNTISAQAETPFPGDERLETRLRHYVRWNAAVMVARANRRVEGIGGHLATYASAAKRCTITRELP